MIRNQANKKRRIFESKTFIPIDCWNIICDYICQHEIQSLCLVSKSINNVVQPIFNAINDHISERATHYEINKKVFINKYYKEDIIPYKISFNTIRKCEDMYTKSFDVHRGMMPSEFLSESYTIAESRHALKLDPILKIMTHIKEGDILYANGYDRKDESGVSVVHNGCIYWCDPDYEWGSHPPLFPLETFPSGYWNNSYYAYSRIVRLDKEKLVCSCDTFFYVDGTEGVLSGREHLKYYLRIIHKGKLFNICYTLDGDIIETNMYYYYYSPGDPFIL